MHAGTATNCTTARGKSNLYPLSFLNTTVENNSPKTSCLEITDQVKSGGVPACVTFPATGNETKWHSLVSFCLLLLIITLFS